MRSIPDNRLSPFVPLPRTDMRGKTREASPKQWQKRKDRRTGLNCVPRALAARPQGVAADRKVRGSRKRGYSAHLIRARRGNKV